MNLHIRRNRRLRGSLALSTCFVLVFLVIQAQVTANTLSFFETRYNTDIASAGVGGMRGSTTGTIALSGVSGTVNKAYLYWNGVTNSSDPNFDADVTVNGTNVTGTSLGFSHDNVWGFQNSQAWRADITAIVTAAGNGNYALSNFDTGSNGASIIVFFDDGNVANDRDVYIFDGNDATYPGTAEQPNTFDTSGWTLEMNGLHYTPAGTGFLRMHVADGQDFTDAPILLNGAVAVPGPQIFAGNSVPPTISFGNLWDIKAFDITSFLSPGGNDLTLTSAFVSDGITMVATLADLPAGAAPDVSDSEPSTACLNPPNHKMKTVTIVGVTDADGDPVTITILSITSDEATDTGGSGGPTHSPDASGVGTNRASLRAERAGGGDGRVYEITFLADDGNGGQTQGSVFVKVPHDNKSKVCAAVDSGQNYDPTQ